MIWIASRTTYNLSHLRRFKNRHKTPSNAIPSGAASASTSRPSLKKVSWASGTDWGLPHSTLAAPPSLTPTSTRGGETPTGKSSNSAASRRPGSEVRAMAPNHATHCGIRGVGREGGLRKGRIFIFHSLSLSVFSSSASTILYSLFHCLVFAFVPVSGTISISIICLSVLVCVSLL